MPSSDTFSIKPIKLFVRKWMPEGCISIDPFARNSHLATYTNDLNPETCAQEHMDAGDFCDVLHERGVMVDVGLFDPPYSTRQIKESYQAVGMSRGVDGSNHSLMYHRVKASLDSVIHQGGVVLSFGWNSSGMGNKSL